MLLLLAVTYADGGLGLMVLDAETLSKETIWPSDRGGGRHFVEGPEVRTCYTVASDDFSIVRSGQSPHETAWSVNLQGGK